MDRTFSAIPLADTMSFVVLIILVLLYVGYPNATPSIILTAWFKLRNWLWNNWDWTQGVT